MLARVLVLCAATAGSGSRTRHASSCRHPSSFCAGSSRRRPALGWESRPAQKRASTWSAAALLCQRRITRSEPRAQRWAGGPAHLGGFILAVALGAALLEQPAHLAPNPPGRQVAAGSRLAAQRARCRLRRRCRGSDGVGDLSCGAGRQRKTKWMREGIAGFRRYAGRGRQRHSPIRPGRGREGKRPRGSAQCGARTTHTGIRGGWAHCG